MKNDLEKCKYMMGCLGFFAKTRIRGNEVELAVYDWDIYLGSFYFDFDGMLKD